MIDMLFDIEEMPDPREDLTCPECGSFLRPTVSGDYSICPKWHGGVHPGLSETELRIIGQANGLSDLAYRILPRNEGGCGG